MCQSCHRRHSAEENQVKNGAYTVHFFFPSIFTHAPKTTIRTPSSRYIVFAKSLICVAVCLSASLYGLQMQYSGINQDAPSPDFLWRPRIHPLLPHLCDLCLGLRIAPYPTANCLIIPRICAQPCWQTSAQSRFQFVYLGLQLHAVQLHDDLSA